MAKLLNYVSHNKVLQTFSTDCQCRITIKWWRHNQFQNILLTGHCVRLWKVLISVSPVKSHILYRAEALCSNITPVNKHERFTPCFFCNHSLMWTLWNCVSEIVSFSFLLNTDFYFHEFSLNRHYHFYCSPFAWHCSPTANQHYGWRNGTVLIAFITSIHNLGEDISVEKTNTPVVEEINCPVSLSEDWLRVILWERSFSGMHSNQN